jgi:hypothetical protein
MKKPAKKTTPEVYIQLGGSKDKKLSYKDQFEVRPQSAETPWVPSRFGQAELLRAVANRRITQNPRLNFVDESSNGLIYEQFKGLGRFQPKEDYDFLQGRPMITNRPESQPDFDDAWFQAYSLSPVLEPESKVKNPLPRQDNIDPNGYMRRLMEEGTTTEIPKLAPVVDENVNSGISVS